MARKVLRASIDADTWEAAPGHNYGTVRRLRLSNVASSKRYAYIFFSRPFPLGATIFLAKLQLVLQGTAWSGGPWTIRAQRITQSWREKTIDWNKAITVTATNAATVAVTGGVDGQTVEIDITAMMNNVAADGIWYGVRLDLDTSAGATGVRKLYSAEAVLEDSEPKIDITWGIPPAAPTDLSPADNQIVVDPVTFQWVYRDQDGTADQFKAQLQIDDTADMSSPIHDTGWVSLTAPIMAANRNRLRTLNMSTVESALGTDFNSGTNASQAQASGVGPWQGTFVYRITATAGGDMSGGTASGTNGTAVTPGETITASLYTKAAVTSRTVRVRVDFYNSGGSNLNLPQDGTGVANNTSTWTRISGTFVVPAGAAFVAVRMYVVGAAASEQHYADGFMLSEGDQLYDWQPAITAAANGTHRYWWVRVQDPSGLISPWSEIAEYTHQAKGTLVVSNPSSGTPVVEETTPPITWTFTPSASETQVAYRVMLYELTAVTGGKPKNSEVLIWDSGIKDGANNSLNIPPKKLTKFDTNAYKVVVRIWDSYQRVAMPGVPIYIEATRTFTLSKSAVPSAVTSLTADPDQAAVVLNFSRATQPDYFALVVDGEVVEDRIDSADAFVSGTSYTYTYHGAKPRQTHTYEVQAVVIDSGKLKHSTGNATDEAMTEPSGIWLMWPDEDLRVPIVGETTRDLSIGEESSVYNPVGRRSPVIIYQSVRGYEGSVSGQLEDWPTVGAAQAYRDALEDMKAAQAIASASEIRLVVGDLNIPVLLGAMNITPNRVGDRYSVSVEVYQSGEFTFRLK